jgi:hypothetical protein
LEVDCLWPARIALNLETDALPFRQVAEARALDGGDVDEYVLGSIIGRDEAKAPSGIEKFYGTSLHVGIVLTVEFIATAKPPTRVIATTSSPGKNLEEIIPVCRVAVRSRHRFRYARGYPPVQVLPMFHLSAAREDAVVAGK